MATELVSLGILSVCALLGGIIATRFRQPAVFGLLLVGAIIGPNALNMVKDQEMINIMADFGAILLLFIIGLEFDVSKLMKFGARYLLIGLLKFGIVLFFGYEIAMLVGLSSKAALFIGVILSFSSTVVIIKVLEQKELFSRKEVPLLIAVLIIEDILAVLALTFFSGIQGKGNGVISMMEHIIISITVLLIAYVLLMKFLKYIVHIILKNNSDDSVLTYLSLGIGTLLSYFAFYLRLTPSAGAFLAGSLIASLPNAKEYGLAIRPYALIFTSIFFISMGTLVDFQAIEANIPLIIILIVTVLITRFIAIGFLTFLLANFKNEQPFFSSIAMISVGEFSLLVAKESEKFALGVDLVTITAAIIFISAILMSMGINYSHKIHNVLMSKVPNQRRIKLERISDYMRKFFDQMEIENFFTKKLAYDSKVALILSCTALFTFFILRRALALVGAKFSPLIVYSFYAIILLFFVYVVNLVFKRLKLIHHTLSVILTNVDSSRNLKKCKVILNYLLMALLLFFIAMLFPFLLFMLELAAWANIIPFALALSGIFFTRKGFSLIDGSHIQTIGYSSGLSFAKL